MYIFGYTMIAFVSGCPSIPQHQIYPQLGGKARHRGQVVKAWRNQDPHHRIHSWPGELVNLKPPFEIWTRIRGFQSQAALRSRIMTLQERSSSEK